jgi:hypothetical protein
LKVFFCKRPAIRVLGTSVFQRPAFSLIKVHRLSACRTVRPGLDLDPSVSDRELSVADQAEEALLSGLGLAVLV